MCLQTVVFPELLRTFQTDTLDKTNKQTQHSTATFRICSSRPSVSDEIPKRLHHQRTALWSEITGHFFQTIGKHIRNVTRYRHLRRALSSKKHSLGARTTLSVHSPTHRRTHHDQTLVTRHYNWMTMYPNSWK